MRAIAMAISFAAYAALMVVMAKGMFGGSQQTLLSIFYLVTLVAILGTGDNR